MGITFAILSCSGATPVFNEQLKIVDKGFDISVATFFYNHVSNIIVSRTFVLIELSDDVHNLFRDNRFCIHAWWSWMVEITKIVFSQYVEFLMLILVQYRPKKCIKGIRYFLWICKFFQLLPFLNTSIFSSTNDWIYGFPCFFDIVTSVFEFWIKVFSFRFSNQIVKFISISFKFDSSLLIWRP